MKVAIYARVSTSDGRQDVDNQLVQLRALCAQNQWQITREYIDHASGKSSAGRSEFQSLFTDAESKSFDLVLVWALDRLTREGILTTFSYMERLSKSGVKLHSLTEPQFSTTGPAGELMLAIAAWIAKQERIRIAERTKAGMALAKARGSKIGREPLPLDTTEIFRLHRAGESARNIAKRFPYELAGRTVYPRRAISRLLNVIGGGRSD